MGYQSLADFCAEYASSHSHHETGVFGQTTTLDKMTVVSETPDTARVEARWYTSGHDPDSGYYDHLNVPGCQEFARRPASPM